MAKISSILLLLSCFVCVFGCQQKSDLTSVKISAVDFDIETPFDVNCDLFEQSFGKEKKDIVFANKADLLHFQSLLKQFKVVKKLQSFDVRGIVNFYDDDHGEKYCFDKFAYFYKDGKYYFNKQLLIFITDRLYKSHPEYLDTLRQYE